MAIEKELLDQLLEGRDPETVFTQDGLLDELKKGLSERVLRECQKICARAVLSDIDEPFAEDDGELCFDLEPFPRRTFPRLGRMIENEI